MFDRAHGDVYQMTGNRNQSSSWNKLPKQLGYGLLAIIIAIAIIGVVPVWAADPVALVQQGKIAYDRGDFPTALTLWERAETIYHRDRDLVGIAGSQVNQAQAAIGMGSYRRACKILTGTVRVDEHTWAIAIASAPPDWRSPPVDL